MLRLESTWDLLRQPLIKKEKKENAQFPYGGIARVQAQFWFAEVIAKEHRNLIFFSAMIEHACFTGSEITLPKILRISTIKASTLVFSHENEWKIID